MRHSDNPDHSCSFPCVLSLVGSSSAFRVEGNLVIIDDSYEEVTLSTTFSFAEILYEDSIPVLADSSVYLTLGSWISPKISSQMNSHHYAVFPFSASGFRDDSNQLCDPLSVSANFQSNSPLNLEQYSLPTVVRFENGTSLILLPDDLNLLYSLRHLRDTQLSRLLFEILTPFSGRVWILAQLSLAMPRFRVEQALKVLSTTSECCVTASGLEKVIDKVNTIVANLPGFSLFDSTLSTRLESSLSEGKALDEEILRREGQLSGLRREVDELRLNVGGLGEEEIRREDVQLQSVVKASIAYCDVLRANLNRQVELTAQKSELDRELSLSEGKWRSQLIEGF
jgi:hypothetical protein